MKKIVSDVGSLAIDLTDQQFGRLSALSIVPRGEKRGVQWLCQCECGNRPQVSAECLRGGDTHSCGCGRNDNRPRGDSHRRAKLSEAQVASQRERYYAGGVAYDQIAIEFGMSKHAVALMLKGTTYAHVPMPASSFSVELERCICGQYRREGVVHVCPERPTHCKHGHLYDEANTYYDKDGWRHCKRCHRESGHNPLRRARVANLPSERIVKSRVLEAHGGLCGICKTPVDPANWHLDHIIPITKDGPHLYSNVQPAHPTCNLSKTNLDLAEAIARKRELSTIDLCQIIWAVGQRKSRPEIAKEFQLDKTRLRHVIRSVRHAFAVNDSEAFITTMGNLARPLEREVIHSRPQ